MLKDPKPPMNQKETSLTTYPEASTKMYGIKKKFLIRRFGFYVFNCILNFVSYLIPKRPLYKDSNRTI